MKRKNSTGLYIFFIAGILILLNILGSRYFLRLDLTEDQRYTLSEATKTILEGLDQPLTVTAYFSEDLPPNIDKTRRDFKDLLSEYATRSRGNIVYEFINPNEDKQVEQKAVQNGIRPVVINVREKDQSVQKRAFLGAILRYGEETEVIPFVQPGSAMEYSLSSGIKKLTADTRSLVGFIQGHGEPSASMMQQAMQSLEVLNQVESVNLTDSTYLPRYETLVLVAPSDSIPPEDLQMLDEYLAGGGNMVVAINRVNGNLNQGRGFEVTTGLETWLKDKGVTVNSDFIVDANCGSVSVVQQQDMFSFTSQMEFPYLPIFNNFEKHPVTSGLETVVMQFASSLTFSGDSSLHYQPLVRSSEKTGLQPPPVFFNIQREWTEQDFPLEHVVAAAVLEGKIAGANNARMVVVGDGDFAVNGQGQQAQQLSPDNVNLLVNSIDWLADDTGLIELRTRGVTSRPLKQIEDGKKDFLKWLNIFLPVVLIILYGLFRMQRNRFIREKRRSEDYNR